MIYNPLHSMNWIVIHKTLGKLLLDADPVEVGEWQSQDVRDKPEMVSQELMNVSFCLALDDEAEAYALRLKPNLPWAEDHFLERVSGKPLNPPPSEAWWPFAVGGNAAHKMTELFSHTYPERIWPKRAGHMGQTLDFERMGIRFAYGDLMDVVDLLTRSPLTRQAYLPLWFPEDTGNAMGERVPCTLGYHFILRGGELHMVYTMRSCDYMRHFTDDIYMAGRLLQWMVSRLNERTIEVGVGTLTAHITSLHIFQGDIPLLRRRYET